jgi:hypothetical protein
MRIVSKQKNLFLKFLQKKSSLEAKTVKNREIQKNDLLQTDRQAVFG